MYKRSKLILKTNSCKLIKINKIKTYSSLATIFLYSFCFGLHYIIFNHNMVIKNKTNIPPLNKNKYAHVQTTLSLLQYETDL